MLYPVKRVHCNFRGGIRVGKRTFTKKQRKTKHSADAVDVYVCQWTVAQEGSCIVWLYLTLLLWEELLIMRSYFNT